MQLFGSKMLLDVSNIVTFVKIIQARANKRAKKPYFLLGNNSDKPDGCK